MYFNPPVEFSPAALANKIESRHDILETYLQRIFDRLDELEVRVAVRDNTNNNTIAGQTAGTATAAKAEAAAAATKRREANQEAQRVHTQPALFEEVTIANRINKKSDNAVCVMKTITNEGGSEQTQSWARC
jgi:hypothetical protein